MRVQKLTPVKMRGTAPAAFESPNGPSPLALVANLDSAYAPISDAAAVLIMIIDMVF